MLVPRRTDRTFPTTRNTANNDTNSDSDVNSNSNSNRSKSRRSNDKADLLRDAVRRGKLSTLPDETVVAVLLNELCEPAQDMDRVSV